MSNHGTPPVKARPLLFDERAMHIEFVSVFQADVTSEFLILTPIQQYPKAEEQLPEGVPPTQAPPAGRVVAQLAITWPHAVRLRDMLDRLIETHRENVIKSVQEAMGREAEDEG